MNPRDKVWNLSLTDITGEHYLQSLIKNIKTIDINFAIKSLNQMNQLRICTRILYAITVITYKLGEANM